MKLLFAHTSAQVASSLLLVLEVSYHHSAGALP
jgi:hypothetical protein